jgi:hypothetical protein
MLVSQTKDIKLSNFRVTCKDGITHTTFMVLYGHTAIPEFNFQIAQGWAAEGLLNSAAIDFLKSLELRKSLAFK